MKHHLTHIFFLLLLATLCSGCKQVMQYPVELLRIDSLTYVNPDSALIRLENLAHQMAEADEPTRNYYQLLMVKAHDKAFHKHSSASTILSVLHYYEMGGDARLLPEAYYYAGRVMRDLGDAPQALDYFQKTIESLERSNLHEHPKNNRNYINLQSVTYAQMGYLFRSQHLYDHAIEAMKMRYFITSNNFDTTGMILSLCDIGQIYQGQSCCEEAIKYYKQSEELAEMRHDTIRLFASICQEAYTLASMGLYQDAEERISLCDNDRYRKDGVYHVVKSIISQHKGEMDSAAQYFSLIEKNGTKDQRAQAQLWIAKYELDRHNPKLAINKLYDFIEYSNHKYQQDNAEVVGLANALYNYQLREKENTKLKIQHVQDHQSIIVTLSATAILSLISLFLVFLIRKNHENTRKQRQRLQQLYESKEKDSSVIKNNVRQISLLQQQLKESSNTCDSLRLQLNELLAQNKQGELAESFDLRWRSTEECNMISNHILEGEPLKNDEWKNIEAKVRLMNPFFISRLLALYDFTDIEWKITLLIRLHVSPSNIATLLCRSYSAVGNARKRLYKKVLQKEGSTEDWDKFILGL